MNSSVLCLQMISRGLIMWDSVHPSREWVNANIPEVRLICIVSAGDVPRIMDGLMSMARNLYPLNSTSSGYLEADSSKLSIFSVYSWLCSLKMGIISYYLTIILSYNYLILQWVIKGAHEGSVSTRLHMKYVSVSIFTLIVSECDQSLKLSFLLVPSKDIAKSYSLSFSFFLFCRLSPRMHSTKYVQRMIQTVILTLRPWGTADVPITSPLWLLTS